MIMKKNKFIKNIVLSGMFLALCLLLPFVTGQIPEIGKALSPMHIPVFLCGYVCGPVYALVVGFTAPILRSAILFRPVMFPDAVAMAFELATYGLIVGILYRALPKKNIYVYISLVLAMLSGRAVWGILRFAISGISNTQFSLAAFISGAFTYALPGIVCHIILIPVIIIALRKFKMIE